MARIQGVVCLRVSTDGKRVSSVEVVSGPPLLARLANDNVKTWLFNPHDPTSFDVTFHYKLLRPTNCDSNCNCEFPEEEGVLLQLPTQVDLNAKIQMGCSPVDLQQPTTVHLKVLHNGHQVAAPTMIKVTFDGHTLRIPVRDGKFVAPPDLFAAQRVTLETDVGGSHIRFIHVTGWTFTYEDWTLRLAEHINADYYEWRGPKGADIPSSCMLEFESVHADPGKVLFEQNCRSKKE
jgi:hypothetical protein